MRAALYPRDSTHEQQTLGLQFEAIAAYIKDRGWSLARQFKDVGSRAKQRAGREGLLKAARRSRSTSWWSGSGPMGPVADRAGRRLRIAERGAGPDDPEGRALAGTLAVFAEFEREVLRERVRAGIAQARREGRPHGRPRTASLKSDEVVQLKAERVSHSEFARRLGIGRTSVRRILAAG